MGANIELAGDPDSAAPLRRYLALVSAQYMDGRYLAVF